MKPDLLLPQNAQEHIETLAKELLGTTAPWLTRTALAVLWLATHRHEVEPMVAQGLVEAAGLRRKQNWALILSSSARVSDVTYETVIAVRYPELDANTPTHVAFGNYLADRQARVGGFMPGFWGSPHNVIHATVDIGAGMTAQHVLLAQTKIGFLTGGRGYSFQELSPEEKLSQREEAFARATVALSTVEAEDVESDLEDLEEHYYFNLRRYSAFLERDRPRHYTTQQLNAQEWAFPGRRDGLERFLSLPTTWPLARLMFPIRDLVKQMETLLQTYCFEMRHLCGS